MNTPEPLMIGGQPIVVGRIVHLVGVNVAGVRRCAPATVTRSTDFGALRLRDIESGETHDSVYLGEKDEPGKWHWPDANHRQCQGRV